MSLLNDGTFSLNGRRLLTPASVRVMATPVWRYNGHNSLTYEEDEDPTGIEQGLFCDWGIGMQTLAAPVSDCHDDPFGDGIQRIAHSGSIDGLQTGIWLDRHHGTGVVWIATGMPLVRLHGRSAFSAVEESWRTRTAHLRPDPSVPWSGITLLEAGIPEVRPDPYPHAI